MSTHPSQVLRWTLRALVLLAVSLAFTSPVLAQVVPGSFIAWFTSRAQTWKDLAAVGLSIGVLSLAWEVYCLREDLDKEYRRFRGSAERNEAWIKAFQEKLSQQQSLLKSSNDSGRADMQALNSKISALGSEVKKLEGQIIALRSTMSVGSSAPIVTKQAEKTMAMPPVGEVVAEQYQLVFDRNDRSALKSITTAELNITVNSEDILVRGSSSEPTQLMVVSGGGSYLLVQRDQKNWLVPTFQTLTGFTSNQPLKGIFAYEPQPVSAAELRCAAEVEENAGVWVVVNLGLVAVPSG